MGTEITFLDGEPNAITCPKCGGHIREVKDSRPVAFEGITAIHRRRVCKTCASRIITIEVPIVTFEQATKNAVRSVIMKLLGEI